jgi:hypothetical protein
MLMHVGVVLLVRRQHVHHHLRLVLEPVRKERTDGTVDEPRRQDVLLRRTTLALEEAAGNLARRIAPRAVLHRQREERQVRRTVLRRHRAQRHRVAVLDQHRAVSLPRHAARLQDQLPAREHPLFPVHFLSLFLRRSAPPLWQRTNEHEYI